MKKDIYILWIACFFHDSSISLLKNGEIIFAIEEEKISRIKHDSSFPEESIKKCLEHCNIKIEDIDYVWFYEKSFIKFENFIKNYINTWPFWFYWFIKWIKEWLKYKLWFSSILKDKTWYKWDIIYLDHHLTHASGAFFSSWYSESAILTIDWVWEESTTTWWVGKWIDINIKEKIIYPHSIWLIYSTFTSYLWFDVNDWEYKMMWLAPYWKPVYQDLILKEIVEIYDNWSFELNMKYFSFQYWRKMFNSKFEKLFWYNKRHKSDEILQFHKDIASSIQNVTELILLKIVNYIQDTTKLTKLCISWWVWLNCVANYTLLKQSNFDKIYVQPSPWDWGSSVGICYYIYHNILRNSTKQWFDNIYLWNDFSDNYIEETLLKYSGEVSFIKMTDNKLIEKVSNDILDNKIVWWFQDRAEFGPRALGNRSILWNPTNKENWSKINLKIKFRESFRPFAPSIAEESLSDYFDLKWEFPYMLFISKIKNWNILPAVTHKDNTSRVQTVNIKQNKKYYLLLKEFEKISWFPILINTSFNLAGEPIVYTPDDAIETYLKCEMDYLVLWNYFIKKVSHVERKN